MTHSEAKFQERGRGFEVRVSARGPDRALCVIRPVLSNPGGESLDDSGELPGRSWIVADSCAVSRTPCPWPRWRSDRPPSRSSRLNGLTDIAQIIDPTIAEQLMSQAILRLPEVVVSDLGFMGQLNDSTLALVLNSSDRELIEGCVAALCASLREPIMQGDAAFHLTPHAGVAILGRDATSPKRCCNTRARRRRTRAVPGPARCVSSPTRCDCARWRAWTSRAN